MGGASLIPICSNLSARGIAVIVRCVLLGGNREQLDSTGADMMSLGAGLGMRCLSAVFDART